MLERLETHTEQLLLISLLHTADQELSWPYISNEIVIEFHLAVVLCVIILCNHMMGDKKGV